MSKLLKWVFFTVAIALIPTFALGFRLRSHFASITFHQWLGDGELLFSAACLAAASFVEVSLTRRQRDNMWMIALGCSGLLFMMATMAYAETKASIGQGQLYDQTFVGWTSFIVFMLTSGTTSATTYFHR
jgi:hypothetical protein